MAHEVFPGSSVNGHRFEKADGDCVCVGCGITGSKYGETYWGCYPYRELTPPTPAGRQHTVNAPLDERITHAPGR